MLIPREITPLTFWRLLLKLLPSVYMLHVSTRLLEAFIEAGLGRIAREVGQNVHPRLGHGFHQLQLPFCHLNHLLDQSPPDSGFRFAYPVNATTSAMLQ